MAASQCNQMSDEKKRESDRKKMKSHGIRATACKLLFRMNATNTGD